jgi:hypothetical protein
MTLFGAAVTAYPGTGRNHSAEVMAHEIDCGPMQMLRTYDGGKPKSWFSASNANGAVSPAIAGWTRRASWHSVKPPIADLASGALDGWVRDYIESIPETGVQRWLTVWHEPITKIRNGSLDPELWLLGNRRFGRVVGDVGHPDVRFGPCFAGKWDLTGSFTLDDLGLTEEDIELWDFIGWDPYHEGSKNGNYSIPLSDYLDPLVYWSHVTAPDVPIAIGETGFIPNPADPMARARYLAEVADYAREHNFAAVCYFDASVTTPWYLRRMPDGFPDPISGKAWGLNYVS